MNRYVLLRYKAGLTMPEAAEKAGVSVGTISGLESGSTKRPSVKTAMALARVYGCEIAELLVEEHAA